MQCMHFQTGNKQIKKIAEEQVRAAIKKVANTCNDLTGIPPYTIGITIQTEFCGSRDNFSIMLVNTNTTHT